MKNKAILIPITILIIIITISIIYNTFPRLQLNGTQNMTISYRDEYKEPGVIVKNANGNYMSKIKIDSNIDTKTIGNYYIDYSLKLGGKTLHVRRNIKVIDDIAPVIKLKGNQITEMSINTEYKEPGYTAVDEYDGDLTDKVEIIGKIDTNNYGEYIITYKVADNNNNTTEVNRIIKIIDEMNPKIQCTTNYTAFKTGTKKPIGCKAIDNFDGDITEKIKITGDYDINTPGIYKIRYEVSDDAGNETSIEHNIIIFEPIENKTAYIITDGNQIKETLEILNTNNIKATFQLPTKINDEYINQIKEEEHQIEQNDIEKQKEQYNNNQIKYIEINKNITDEEIKDIIKKLNDEKRIIIIFNNQETTETLNLIIQILREMNYKFDTINNIK